MLIYRHEIFKKKKMSRDMSKPTKWVCAQRRLRSAWASADLSIAGRTLIFLVLSCRGWDNVRGPQLQWRPGLHYSVDLYKQQLTLILMKKWDFIQLKFSCGYWSYSEAFKLPTSLWPTSLSWLDWKKGCVMRQCPDSHFSPNFHFVEDLGDWRGCSLVHLGFSLQTLVTSRLHTCICLDNLIWLHNA